MHQYKYYRLVHNFPQGICPKVKVIGRLELELAYYDSAVQRFNHNTTGTPIMLVALLYLSKFDLGSRANFSDTGT